MARPIADAFMGRVGARLQMRNEPVSRREGNLFKPVPQGVGPTGTGAIKPTAWWKRGLATLALVGTVGGAVGAAGFGAMKLARR